MADRAVLVAQNSLVMKRRNIRRDLHGNAAVTFEAELPDLGTLKHFRIRRSVRCMTCRTTLGLKGRMLENEWALFIGMAFNASRIRPDGELSLFLFKTAVRIVAIAAFHRPFEDLVPERLAELCFHFGMTAYAELRFAGFQHCFRCFGRLLL